MNIKLKFLFYFLKPTYTVGLLFSLLLFLNSCAVLQSKSKADAAAFQAKDSVFNDLFMKAQQDLMLGNNASALKRFEKVVSLQPGNATAHYQLSRLWLGKNDVARSLSEIELAHQYDPENKWISDQYAMLLGINGEYKKAASLYGQLAKKEPAPEEYLMKQAFSLEKAGRNKQALAVLDRVKEYAGADDEAVLYQRRNLFLKLNQTDQAIAENKLLIKYHPEKPEYVLLLANLYVNLGRKAEGLALFKEADRKFPDNPKVQAALVRYYLIYDQAKVRGYLDDIILKRKGSLEDKINILGILKMAPRQDSFSRNITTEYVARLASQDPPDPKAILFYGMILHVEGRQDSAALAFKKVITLDSANYIAWQQLFAIEADLDQMDSLIETAERARVVFPKDPIINYFDGYAHLMKKEYDRAIAIFQDGLTKLAPDDTSLSVQFHTFLGDAFQEQKKYEEATQHYEAALKLAPESMTILNNYSYFLAEQGIRLEEAEKMSAKTIKQHPGEAVFLDTYGWILYKQGKFKEAKKYLEKALMNMKESADKSTTYEHLGDTEYQLGNKEGALQNWIQAQKEGGTSKALLEKIKTKKLTP